MPSSLLKVSRLTHLYLGVFAAPALIFFAFTGAIQTFSLHETTRGSSYVPPRILVVLGQIHKKQTPVVAAKKPGPDAAPKEAGPKAEKHADDAGLSAKPTGDVPAAIKAPAPPPAPKHNPLPLKIFFLVVAISLVVSTFSGIYMSYKYTRNKAVISVLLLLGVVIPVLMVVL
jgi:uncharacterized iron-regulated membrane protein